MSEKYQDFAFNNQPDKEKDVSIPELEDLFNNDISAVESFLLENLNLKETNLQQAQIFSFINSKLKEEEISEKSFSRDFVLTVSDRLYDCLNNGEGSYIGGIKMYDLLNDINYFLNKNTFYLNEADYPIKLNSEQFILNIGGESFTTKGTEYYRVINDLIGDLLTIDNMIETLHARGSKEEFSNLAQTRHEKIEDIKSYFTTKFGNLDDFFRTDKTNEDKSITTEEYKEFALYFTNDVRGFLKDNFEIDLVVLPVYAQFNLYRTLKNTPFSEKENIDSYLKEFGVKGIMPFMSFEYDSELFKKVVDSVNSSHEDYSELLDTLWNTAVSMSSLFDKTKYLDIDENLDANKFFLQTHEAVYRRIKDILKGFFDVPDVQKKKDALVGLESIGVIFGILDDLTDQSHFKNSFENFRKEHDSYKCDVHNKENGYQYGLKITVRPKSDKNGEARINFELNFDTQNPNKLLRDAFNQSITRHKDNKTTTFSSLRIGVDRDTFDEEPKISLDLGRNKFKGKSFERTGDVLGNLLEEIDFEDKHHTTKSFTTEFAREDTFEIFAEGFKAKIDNLFTLEKKVEENFGWYDKIKKSKSDPQD